MPRGFVSDLSSLIVSPSVLLLTNRNAYEERILRETQSFVYTLNTDVQTEYIRSNSHFLDILVQRRQVPRRSAAPTTCSGSTETQQAHRGGAGAASGRQPGARATRSR